MKKDCWNPDCNNVSSKAKCRLSSKRMNICPFREPERFGYAGMVGNRRFDRADSFDSLYKFRKDKEKAIKEKEELKMLRKIVKGVKKKRNLKKGYSNESSNV